MTRPDPGAGPATVHRRGSPRDAPLTIQPAHRPARTAARSFDPSPPGARGDAPVVTPVVPPARDGSGPSWRSPSRSWPCSAVAPCSCPASSLGRGTRPSRGPRAAEEQAFQPFWDAYHAIREYARAAGRSPQGHHRGRDPGHGRGHRRSLLDLPLLGGLSGRRSRTSTAQFEGIGAGSGTVDAGGQTGAAPARRDCQLVVVTPLDGSPAQRRPA